MWPFTRRAPATQEERYSLDEYNDWVQQFSFGGLAYQPYQQTLINDRERIGVDFESLVRGAYASNGVVFACMLARRAVFTEARFQWRDLGRDRPGRMFGTRGLEILETPHPGGVTGDMLARMIDDVDLAGNWFGYRDSNEIVRLRPDWVDIVLEPRTLRNGHVGYRKLGYMYFEQGARSDGLGVPFLADEVAHFAPIPDPLSPWRGMSWLTPVVREITADRAATTHKLKFFENGATPNMVVTAPKELTFDQFKRFKDHMDDEHKGVTNAYKTLYLGGGVNVEVVGKDLSQIEFKATQGAGETRIATAAGVPPVLIGLSEGLSGSSLNQGNYASARRNFADRVIRPLWRNAAGALQVIVPPPPRSQLWVDDRDVAFLREDERDRAEIQAREATTIRQLTDGGYTPDSVQAAVMANDWSLLVHSGLLSVQLQPPGATVDNPTGAAGSAAPADTTDQEDTDDDDA